VKRRLSLTAVTKPGKTTQSPPNTQTTIKFSGMDATEAYNNMKKDIIFQTFCTTLQSHRRQMQRWLAMDLQETYYIATQTPEYIPAQNLVHIRTRKQVNA